MCSWIQFTMLGTFLAQDLFLFYVFLGSDADPDV